MPRTQICNRITCFSECLSHDDCNILKFVAVAALVLLAAPSRAQSPMSPPIQWLGYLAVGQAGDYYPQGSYTKSNLVQIRTGVFIGTAQGGGPEPQYPCPSKVAYADSGCGTIYQLDTTKTPPTITVLWPFSGALCGTVNHCVGDYDGAQPAGTIAWDGTFIYGTTQGNASNCASTGPPACGTIYRFKPSTLEMDILYSMQPAPINNGFNPVTGVMLANGNLYGTTSLSNDFFQSSNVFAIANPAHAPVGVPPAFTPINASSQGNYPQTPMEYSDGNLYFAMNYGGEILQFDPATNLINTCVSASTSGLRPVGRLAVGADLALYGVSNTSSSGYGEVFRVDLSKGCSGASLVSFYTFGGVSTTDGGTPIAGILSTASGDLYGTGTGGGTDSSGNSVVGEIYSLGISMAAAADPTGIKAIQVDPKKSSSGTNYQIGDRITVAQGGASGGTAAVASTGSGGSVTGLSLLTGGTGYSAAYGLATTGGNGTGLQIDILSALAEQPLYWTPTATFPYLIPQAELTDAPDGFVYGTSITPQPGQIVNTNGAMFRFLPPPRNALQIGTNGVYDSGGQIAVDAQPQQVGLAHPGPRIYIAGQSDSNLVRMYGGTGGGGFFLARYFSDGTLDTSFAANPVGSNNGGYIQFGTASVSLTSGDYVAGVAVDLNGNVLLAGSTSSAVGLLGCSTNQGGSDIWVASYSPAGTLNWCKMFGSTQNDWALGLTLDSIGSPYITGTSFGSLPGGTLQGTADAFIARVTAKSPHALKVYEFAAGGADSSAGESIAYCGSNLYLSVDASNGSSISEYTASSFTQVTTLALPATYSAGPVATDANCSAYLGAESTSIGSQGTQEFFALQKYDKSLNKKWETDGPRRVVPPPLVLPENILGLAVDPAGAVYASGGTNFNLYNRPLPTNCSLSGLPGFYCAGWFAAYNSSSGAELSHSPQEFGDSATLVGPGDGFGGQGYGGIATDMYGNIHVSGSTSGPAVAGGEFETTSSDAFEMDFGPTAYFPARAPTSISLTAVPNPATHGSPVTLTATVTSGGSAVTSGSVTFVSDGFAPEGYTILNSQSARVNASGVATLTTTVLPVGSDNVSAVYTGTLSKSPGTSTITVTVQ